MFQFPQGISSLEKDKTRLRIVGWGSKMKTERITSVKWKKHLPKTQLPKGKSWHNLKAKQSSECSKLEHIILQQENDDRLKWKHVKMCN